MEEEKLSWLIWRRGLIIFSPGVGGGRGRGEEEFNGFNGVFGGAGGGEAVIEGGGRTGELAEGIGFFV